METQCHKCGTFLDDWRDNHVLYPHLCKCCGNWKELATKEVEKNALHNK